MHQRAFFGTNWARGGTSEVVRRAHPASGAQWNVQIVRGKVNGKCLWNACKALSLGLLLMVLGAAMATIGYYADHLSIAQEIRGNHTVRIKNESRGFHLNNLSYAGPIVMGVGGFIVVAACVMTFEARDSAAKVVPARLKLSTTGPAAVVCGNQQYGGPAVHGSLKTSGSQTGNIQQSATHLHGKTSADRQILTESFLTFSRGLSLKKNQNLHGMSQMQCSITRSPSAPNLVLEHHVNSPTSPGRSRCETDKANIKNSKKMFAHCALLNPTLLHRHALSVDETDNPNYRLSRESLHSCGSQGSLALDLHLECPITLRIHDKRRNPLLRQKRVDEDEKHAIDDNQRRDSKSCSPRPIHFREASKLGSSYHIPNQIAYSPSCRRSSNASDSSHRSRAKRIDTLHNQGRLARAISSDSRLTGANSKAHRHYATTRGSIECHQEGSCSDTDIRKVHDMGHTISSGIDNVKDAVHSVFSSAGNTIEAVVGKMGNDVNVATNEMKGRVNDMKEDADGVMNSANEAISEAETVLASEAEQTIETVESTTMNLTEQLDTTKNDVMDKLIEMKTTTEGALQIEDIDENFDMLGHNVEKVDSKIEEIDTNIPTPVTSPLKETKKEE